MAFGKRKHDADDDGRVIANMNVAGMPWFDSKAAARRRLFGRGVAVLPVTDAELGRAAAEPLDGKTTRWLIKNSVLASLLIVSVYLAVFVLFILFCVFIWFR